MVHRSDGEEPSRWWALTAACLAVFALLVNVSIVVVALPEIGLALDAGYNSLRWVISGYALALATLILGAGSLADLLGHRRLFLVGLGVFLVASAACGAAGSSALLLGARLAQGAAAALLFSTSLALIASAFPGAERATALGIWAATTGIATSAGPLLGGALLELGSWRWIFFVNIPIVLIAIGVVTARVRVGMDGVREPIDWTGQACAAAALFLFLYALIEGADHGWTSTLTVATLVGSGTLLAAFVAVERRVRHPMLDLSLLRRRGVLGGASTAFSIHAAFFSMFIFLAIYLQSVLGYTPLETGLILVPPAAATAIVSAFTSRMARAAGVATRVASGLVLICVGLLLMHGLGADSRWTALLAGLVVGGAGVGVANPAIMGAALGAVEPARGGIASGLNVTFRQLGTAIGVGGLGTVLYARAQSEAAELMSGTGDGAVEAAQVAALGSLDRGREIAPVGFREQAVEAGRTAYAAGLDTVLYAGAGIAAFGALVAVVLLRGVREAGAPAPAAKAVRASEVTGQPPL